ncbi:MAG: F0F1 ATP synthase subunit C [Gammaproteobacteria bacterium]|nr:MAG: F0F1 ATP synthase subunit C [Gammaproteobacteria bacterium]
MEASSVVDVFGNVGMYSIVAVAVIVCVAAVTTGAGFTVLGCKFFDSCVRQPELMPDLQVKLFIIAGLVDAVSMIGVGVAMIFAFSNPVMASLVDFAKEYGFITAVAH